MKENQKKRDIKAFLLLKPDRRPAGAEIWRYNEWALPGLLSGLLAVCVLWPLSHFYKDMNMAVLIIIILAIYFIVHIAVMLYRKRHQ